MSIRTIERCFANTFVHRALHKAVFALAMLGCVALGLPGMARSPDAAPRMASTQEWPSQWDGAALRPLALSEVEQRFAAHFPGAIARLTDGERMFVMRQVDRPTRMLHSAADCYRALGYRIVQARLEQDARARLWRCFNAERGGQAKLRVCERIVDARGEAFTDTSAWYWAGASGRSAGPWQAVTVATPL
ncbi:Uncharacterised protein [Xylophilus ampelinus]|nr:hypothetical protein [Variovorax sp.]VTY38185.1 Uncharacterised protein [Xylophilus ampelinus]